MKKEMQNKNMVLGICAAVLLVLVIAAGCLDDVEAVQVVINLGDLDDVDTTGVGNDQVIKFNSTSGFWEPANDQTGGGGGGNPFNQDLNTSDNVVFNLINASCGNSSEWCQAYNWGDHAAAGYLTSESDPIYSGDPASGITAGNITNWDQAYNWGDHSIAGYDTTNDSWYMTGGRIRGDDNVGISTSPLSYRGLSIYHIKSDDTGHDAGVGAQCVINGPQNMVKDCYGLWLSAETHRNYDDYSAGNLIGIKGVVNLWGEGNVSNAYGCLFQINNRNYSYVTNARTFHIQETKNLNPLGTVNNAFGLYIDNFNDANNNYAIYSRGARCYFNTDKTADSDFRISGDTDTNLFFVDTSADRIGIGTNTPDATLEVEGNMEHDGGFYTFNEDNGNNDFTIESQNDPLMFFMDASADRIGISDDTPSYTLDIDGDIQAQGAYYADGLQGWSGTFTNGDGDIVTVNDGIITDVSPP